MTREQCIVKVAKCTCGHDKTQHGKWPNGAPAFGCTVKLGVLELRCDCWDFVPNPLY